jgi:hypothetical protein
MLLICEATSDRSNSFVYVFDSGPVRVPLDRRGMPSAFALSRSVGLARPMSKSRK